MRKEHKNCDLKVFENINESIFHCQKNNWYRLNEKNKKIWDEKKVNEFWDNLRKYIENKKRKKYLCPFIFDSFIFPDINIDSLFNIPINKEKELLEDFYFWQKGNKLEFNSYLKFKNCTFYDLSFENVTFDSIVFEEISCNEIKLTNIKVNNLYFKKINNNCSIEISDLNENVNCSFSEIGIDYLNLSNTKFEELSINTSTFYCIEFSSVIVNKGLFISSTIEEIWSNYGFNITNKDTFTYLNMNVKKANREYFRLFKNYFFDKKDYINGNIMYQKEMDSHLKETYHLFINKCENGFSNFENLLIAGFGKYSSNFGQSWILPLFWIIFTLFINLYFTSEFNIFDLFRNVPKLLDEMARLLYIKDKEDFGIIDLLFKVPIGLFMYQLTVAIKRKTKY